MCHIESHHTPKETSSNCCKAVQCHIICVLHSSEVEIHSRPLLTSWSSLLLSPYNPSVVEEPAFRAFVENLNPRYSVPSNLRSTPLPAKTADKTATTKSLFSSVKCVSLTLDLWSSRDICGPSWVSHATASVATSFIASCWPAADSRGSPQLTAFWNGRGYSPRSGVDWGQQISYSPRSRADWRQQISYSPRSGADKRSSYAIRPAAGRVKVK